MAVSTIKAVRQDSGTTNYSAITWQRYGKVIVVTVRNASDSGQSITGLPTPKADYVIAALATGLSLSGYIQYLNSDWQVNGSGYGGFSYIGKD